MQAVKIVNSSKLSPLHPFPGSVSELVSGVVKALYKLPILTTTDFLRKGKAIELPNGVTRQMLKWRLYRLRKITPKQPQFQLWVFVDKRTKKSYAWRRKPD